MLFARDPQTVLFGIIAAVVLCATTVVGVIANAVVVVVVLGDSKMRRCSINLLLTNLVGLSVMKLVDAMLLGDCRYAVSHCRGPYLGTANDLRHQRQSHR